MEELIDLIATDESPSVVTDQIKNLLYAKAAEKIESQKSSVAASLFADSEATHEEE
jgi:hypothetical protein